MQFLSFARVEVFLLLMLFLCRFFVDIQLALSTQYEWIKRGNEVITRKLNCSCAQTLTSCFPFHKPGLPPPDLQVFPD